MEAACGRASHASTRSMPGGRAAFLAAAAAHTLALLFDGRYRGFPVAGYAVPAAIFAVMAYLGGRQKFDPGGRALALVLAAGAIAVAAAEGPANSQAIGWALTATILALPWLIPGHGRSP